MFASGDMGGYMGLLLGGSAITVCELLDLFVYNLVRKSHARKHQLTKVKPITNDKSPITVQPLTEKET